MSFWHWCAIFGAWERPKLLDQCILYFDRFWVDPFYDSTNLSRCSHWKNKYQGPCILKLPSLVQGDVIMARNVTQSASLRPWLGKSAGTPNHCLGMRVENPLVWPSFFKYFWLKEKRRPGTFVTFVPRLYNCYNHAHAPGPHMWPSPVP